MKRNEINKLDSLWSRLVKDKAGRKCEYCLEENVWLNAAHIIGRSYRATRWLLENGMCLCFGCHRIYDEHLPGEDKIRNIVVGEDRYNKLQEMKKVIAKNQDFTQIKQQLEGDYEQARRKDEANTGQA